MRVDVELTGRGGGIDIGPQENHSPELLHLGDREAYLWKVPGTTVDGSEVTVLSFYTAWDNIGLDCTYYAYDPSDPFLKEVEASLRSTRVVDGQQHPMRLSIHSQYLQIWPFTNPLLQIWWFAAVFIGGGILGTLWFLRS